MIFLLSLASPIRLGCSYRLHDVRFSLLNHGSPLRTPSPCSAFKVLSCITDIQSCLAEGAPALKPCLLDPATAHLTFMVLNLEQVMRGGGGGVGEEGVGEGKKGSGFFSWCAELLV
jgi:hypothetical protein